MTERVVVRQNAQYEVDLFATDPRDVEGVEVVPVENLYDLTPYTMLLTSLGTCTTILLHSYAENHNIPLEEAEVRLTYQELETGTEGIVVFVGFGGDELTETQRQRLFQVSEHCSIHKLLHDGMQIEWMPYVEEDEEAE